MAEALNTNFSDSVKYGKIVLYENHLLNGNDGYYGRFERRTIDTNTLIARIQQRKAGTNELAVQQIAGFLKEEVLQALRSGEAVNVLDLGTLYLMPNGKFEDASFIADEKQPLTAKFTPSRLTQQAAAEVGVNDVVMSNTTAVITSVTDQYTGSTGGVLTAGKTVLITGKRLKLGGDGSGIFLCPLDEKQQPAADESRWIPCTAVTQNTKTHVEFFLPESAVSGMEYRIILRSFISGNGTLRKTAREVVSDIVMIE